MKILVVHNAYQLAGGEDSVVRNEVALLQQHSHDVQLHLVSNDSVRGLLGKISAAAGVVFSPVSYFRIRKILREQQPDIVHVHNFFPLISPAVFYACKASHIPVVMTLHNYRLVCPTALLMHDGKVTERSLTHGPWWTIPKRVYRNSYIGTLMLALMIATHKTLGTWNRTVGRFILLSQFSVSKFVQAGINPQLLTIKPNFVDVEQTPEQERAGFLFVGRLSQEKGIDVLLSALRRLHPTSDQPAIKVSVAGDGPLAGQVQQSVPLVEPLGSLKTHEVRQWMSSSNALILPSVWYEGFPMVIVEAYACGLPIIASRIGALAELIEDGVTGLLFNPGDDADLAAKIQWANQHPEKIKEMGRLARQRYEEKYTSEKNYQELIAIYEFLVSEPQ
ncbi:glycosyltransferase family 4 protein [Methylobacillus gramineus]|uniref:glycosyltransferase family 4 protein n=1 Tax=Methylobacillus gramineus TaxID=755169 RepID=UPI001CFF7459|nr:glycosyltransferase family 4 protein [Methylobacillus gramineus]MCB5183702.1 glycosyltransferase family 4 protein [Methylobacillus gramineus]